MVSLNDYMQGWKDVEYSEDKFANGDEILVGGHTKYIIAKVPKYDSFVILRADGSGICAMGMHKGPISHMDVRRYFGVSNVAILTDVKIKPGTQLRGRYSNTKYTIAFFCGVWKFINCETGATVETLNYNECTLDAAALKGLIRDTNLYDVVEA